MMHGMTGAQSALTASHKNTRESLAIVVMHLVGSALTTQHNGFNSGSFLFHKLAIFVTCMPTAQGIAQ